MTEENELHPVTALLLKRVATHPEEICDGRWDWVLAEIVKNGSEAERIAVEPVVRKLKLDGVYQRFMRELLAPEQGSLFSVGSVNKNINPYQYDAYQSELIYQQAIDQAMKLK